MVKIIKNITTEAKLTKENEIMGKILLEVALKHRNFTHPHEYKSDEEIAELLSDKNWRENNQFWITSQGWVSYKSVKRHQIVAQSIIPNYEKKITGQTEEKEELEDIIESKSKEIEKLETRIEELKEAVELERKNHMQFVDKSEEWHERKVFEVAMRKDVFITELKLKVQELEKTLRAKDEKITELVKSIEPKPKKFQQFRKLINTTKEKVLHTKVVHAVGGKIQEKFCAYVLQSHILQKNK